MELMSLTENKFTACFPKQIYPVTIEPWKGSHSINITIVLMRRQSLQMDKLLCRLFSLQHTNKPFMCISTLNV